ncbi:MAG: hypothetical protein ACRC9N_11525 [Aeromonas sp.]
MAIPKNNPIKPLLPLEYCKLDRAARLLGCEDGDLLHWGAIGAIKLYGWLNTGSCMAAIYDERTEGESISNDLIVVGELAAYSQIRNISSDIYFARLDGMWRIGPVSIRQIESNGATRKLVHVSASYEPDGDVNALLGGNLDDAKAILGTDLKDWPCSEGNPNKLTAGFMSGDLWIMRDDMELVNKHIQSGTPFTIRPDETKNFEDVATRHRRAIKQSAAIVELLNHAGFTSEVLQENSIKQLQGRLSTISQTLATADAKTVIAWLRDGGINR